MIFNTIPYKNGKTLGRLDLSTGKEIDEKEFKKRIEKEVVKNMKRYKESIWEYEDKDGHIYRHDHGKITKIG